MTKSLGARLLSELNAAHGSPDTLVRRAPQHGNPAMELKGAVPSDDYTGAAKVHSVNTANSRGNTDSQNTGGHRGGGKPANTTSNTCSVAGSSDSTGKQGG